MSKAWMIAKREFRHNLRRPAFLFAAFGTPLFIVGIWIVIFIFAESTQDETLPTNQIGYVDNADVIATEPPIEMADSQPLEGEDESTTTYTFVAYESAEAARAALDDEAIAAYYVIPSDYRSTANVERYNYDDLPPDSVNGAFRRLLLQELSAQLENGGVLRDRLSEPVGDMTVTLMDSNRVISESSLPVLILIPFFFAILFFLASQTTSSFLMNGLVEEKKNHIIEILVTTVTPMQLLTGKIMGLGLLGVLQVVVWVLVVIAAFVLGPTIPMLSIFEGAVLPVDLIVLGVVYFLLGYFLTASLLSAIGVIVGSEQQSNQYAAFIMLPSYFLPLVLSAQFIMDANGTVPTLLSILPVTAPVSMIMRLGFTSVPFWQLALSIGLQLLAMLFAIWASAKLFRWGLLLYGKKITLRDVLQVLRSGKSPEPGTIYETARKEA